MSAPINLFFKEPIRNSPYEPPREHWELDAEGQPTQRLIPLRRPARFLTPIPPPKKKKGAAAQKVLVFDEGKGLSSEAQQYTESIINELRSYVTTWRGLPRNSWNVTPETARLLEYWRSHSFNSVRPFFCQIEAVETAIWLTEVAPQDRNGKKFIQYLAESNEGANPGLSRLALKLATGAGKTTVMAMLIAWQAINAVRRPQSRKFTRGFLVLTPGITIKDRLQVLLPSDLNSYYQSRELVPVDLLGDVRKAIIVLTNFHSLRRRETLELAKGNRSLLQGRGPSLSTIETEGQMLQRVMPSLMGMKNIIVINDEGHHCYREKPAAADAESVEDLKGDDRREAEKNNEKARVWISGIEAVARKLGVARVFDLSATPFFLRGSGYAEGTLFPWTMSDFSLMDAIESGIVKLPRVPVADNARDGEMPMFRELWKHIGPELPKARKKGMDGGQPTLPAKLVTALDALYRHYAQTFEEWRKTNLDVPPCFIIVCQNTGISKLIYDYIAGVRGPDGVAAWRGAMPLFRNFDQNGNPLSRPNAILVDSEQLESGEALDKDFRAMAEDEIEHFRREIVERTGDRERAAKLSDQDLLREVMNTVGRPGRLGAEVRCVVSVSMLTEGWDANTVTHVLGVRAFGTQLLCEQVIGRALRRQSYDLGDDGKFRVEYADVFGIPFDFNAEPVVAPPQPPQDRVHVFAVSPDRDAARIEFPRVVGYRIDLPTERLTAKFGPDSTLDLTTELVGATDTENAGIIGESASMTVAHLREVTDTEIVYKLAAHLVMRHWRGGDGQPQLLLFGQLKRIVRQWVDEKNIHCHGETYRAQVLLPELADMACNKILSAIQRGHEGKKMVRAVLDPHHPVIGSTDGVNFHSSKTLRWKTAPHLCHVNLAILDSGWEGEFCRVVERHPRVRAYVKNHGLGFEVPYLAGSEAKRYRPDFIVRVDDGRADGSLLNLVVEIKGYRGEDAKEKRETMDTKWVPAVNEEQRFGRWAFLELTQVDEIGSDFAARVEKAVNAGIADVLDRPVRQAMA